MNISRKFALSLMAFTFFGSTVVDASAATWQQTHPRRVEVNDRLAVQKARINLDVATGKITSAQATKLHKEDRAVRAQERFDGSLNDTHVTKAEKRSLNQNENAISRQIYRDAH
jgi:hypothetical protein